MEITLAHENTWGVSKWVLREVLYRHVPREMIERPKKGFSVPLGQWLRGPLRDWAEALLNEQRLEQDGYLNSAVVRRVWSDHLQGKRDHSLKLWSILMFQAWLENNGKIMHVITGLGDGGAEGVLTRLCLLSKNLEHEVVSLIDAGKYGEVLVAAGIKVHYLKMNPARPNPLKLIKLISIIRESKPSVVQTWMYHADLLGGIAAKLAGVKRIIWGVRHSTLDKGNAKRSTIYVAWLLAKLSYFIPDKIVCCARKALEVHSDLGYDKSKLILIPNGYDLESLRHDPEAGFRIRKELCISKDSF